MSQSLEPSKTIDIIGTASPEEIGVERSSCDTRYVRSGSSC